MQRNWQHKLLTAGLILLMSLAYRSVKAVPSSFEWGSFDSLGSTAFGVYDADDTTILQTGDIVQLIWAGPDGIIDAPLPDRSPGDDDQLLDASAVENQGAFPPPLRDKGYIPLKTYSFDSEDSQNGGTVYIRAWNADELCAATAYGDSATGVLTPDGTLNSPRWYTNQSVSACIDVYLPIVLNGDG